MIGKLLKAGAGLALLGAVAGAVTRRAGRVISQAERMEYADRFAAERRAEKDGEAPPCEKFADDADSIGQWQTDAQGERMD